MINQINSLVVGYTNKIRETRQNNEIINVKMWLKDNDILAVPYDKGTGFCLMKRETYMSKCKDSLALSRFKKEETNLLLNEEKKFREKLLKMKKSNLISEKFYKKVKPVGSQPARFYGLAKVHKKNTPL